MTVMSCFIAAVASVSRNGPPIGAPAGTLTVSSLDAEAVPPERGKASSRTPGANSNTATAASKNAMPANEIQYHSQRCHAGLARP